jgi:hypothetical protein
MKSIKLLMLAFFLITMTASAQFDYTKKLIGITIKTGLSYGVNDPVNANPLPRNYLSAAWGFYRYYNVNTKNNSLIPFHYLKAEVNTGFRTGFFTINDLNQQAALRTNYIELVLLAPFTWEINDHIAANIGFGGGIVWVRRQAVNSDIVPTPIIKDENSIKGSFLFDYHLLFVGKSNAVVGSRILIETSRYAYGEWSIYFGFGLPIQKLKDKIKKWVK